jgi:hypothetical protein
MKSIEQQFAFLDATWLPLHGIRAINDYETIISIATLEAIPNGLTLINARLGQMLDTFPVKRFNLCKTNNQILTHKQAFNLLIICLELSEVPHTVWTEHHNRKAVTYLRLISKNKLLDLFIENKTSDLRHNLQRQMATVTSTDSKKEKAVLTLTDLINQIDSSQAESVEFPIKPNMMRQPGRPDLEIDLGNNQIFGEYITQLDVSTENIPFDCKLCLGGDKIMRTARAHEFFLRHVIVSDKVIIPLGLNDYQQNKLLITFNDADLPMITDQSTIKCEFTTVKFNVIKRTEFKDSIVRIPFGETNTLVYENRMMTVTSTQTPKITLRQWPCPVDWCAVPFTEQATNEAIKKLGGEFTAETMPFLSIRSIGQRRIATSPLRPLPDDNLIRVLVGYQPKLDIVEAPMSDLFYYTSYIKDNQIVITRDIRHVCDLMRSLSISGLPAESIVTVMCHDRVVLTLIKQSDGRYVSALESNTYLNLLNGPAAFTIKAVLPITYLPELMAIKQSFQFNYVGCILDTDLRRTAAHSAIYLLDLNYLIDNVKTKLDSNPGGAWLPHSPFTSCAWTYPTKLGQ